MIVAASDLHRLVVRVAVVTIALRAVSIFSTDAFAMEVEAMLAAAGGLVEPGRLLTSTLTELTGSIAAVARLPTLLCDLGVVLAVMAYARAAGWGTIAGLLAGAVAAMAPFALEQGWRASTFTLAPVAGIIGLWQLRAALRRGRPLQAGLSALAMVVATFFCAPALVLLPSAWWLAARSVAMPSVRAGAALAWAAAAAAGLAMRWSVVGVAGPVPSDAMAWLVGGADAGSLVADPLAFAVSSLVAQGVGGPTGPFAHLAEMSAAPSWRLVIGAVLALVAAFGLLRGLVREDPPKAPPRPPLPVPSAQASGAAEADGWRSLGVAHASAPRALGERDWMPLLLPAIGAAVFAGFQAASGVADGVLEAAAMARPTSALLIGVGLAAAGLLPAINEETPGPGHRRSVALLGMLALLVFTAGGHALLSATAASERAAPRKIAAFIASELGGGQAVLVGAGGLRVRWKLGGGQPNARLHLAAPEAAAAGAALDAVLKLAPATIVLAGDRAILGEDAASAAVSADSAAAIGVLLDRQLGDRGYALQEDGHRFLGSLALRVYQQQGAGDAGDRSAIRPQLAPGVAP